MKLTTGKKHQYRNFRVKILRWEKYWKILWIFWCGIENHVQIFRYPFLSDTKIYIFAFASDWFNLKKIRIWKGLDVSNFFPFFKSVFQNNFCVVQFQNNIQSNLINRPPLDQKILAVVDRRSLFIGHWSNKTSKWNLRMAFVMDRWSL